MRHHMEAYIIAHNDAYMEGCMQARDKECVKGTKTYMKGSRLESERGCVNESTKEDMRGMQA